MILENIECACCGLEYLHHVGDKNCFREIVWVHPRKVSCENDKWIVDGQTVSEFTLFQQRLYYQHPNGMWSRLKSKIEITKLLEAAVDGGMIEPL